MFKKERERNIRQSYNFFISLMLISKYPMFFLGRFYLLFISEKNLWGFYEVENV